jgi:hypothetical protein
LCYDVTMACIPGQRPANESEAYWAIAEWHEVGYDVKDSLGMYKLHDWLGWTYDEYAQYVYDGIIPKENPDE